jgi:excisionase family DNA binding protein
MEDHESDASGRLDEVTQRLRCSNGQTDGRGTPSQGAVRVSARIGRSESESSKKKHRNQDDWTLPMTVKEAARFLGVSTQTVYLWVERKQIPHFRVMGRNIRFLKSDLKPFRAQFRYGVENGKTA